MLSLAGGAALTGEGGDDSVTDITLGGRSRKRDGAGFTALWGMAGRAELGRGVGQGKREVRRRR